MDEATDLVRQMLANPEDDAIRGVIADWLLEHGHDKLADVFRAALNERAHQLRLARIAAAAQVYSSWEISESMNPDDNIIEGSLVNLSDRILGREFHQYLGE